MLNFMQPVAETTLHCICADDKVFMDFDRMQVRCMCGFYGEKVVAEELNGKVYVKVN